MEEEDADPNDWRSRQTLRRPQQFKVMRQPPLHLDLRHAPLDEAAAVGPRCFVATHFHLYVFESSRLHEVPSMEGGSGNGASGGRQAAPGDGGLGMCLGLLLLQELPELPPFTVYEAAREEGQPPARYQCCLRYCRTVNFSLGKPLLPRCLAAPFLTQHGQLPRVLTVGCCAVCMAAGARHSKTVGRTRGIAVFRQHTLSQHHGRSRHHALSWRHGITLSFGITFYLGITLVLGVTASHSISATRYLGIAVSD